MEYRIAREGTTYGPYTEAQLREYLASGNIVESDLARSDTMTEWLPLKKVLPKIKKQPRGTLDATGLRRDLPSPPDMPWWMALLLEGFTGLTFFLVWNVVEAAWLYRVQKRCPALWYYSIAALLFALNASNILSKNADSLFSTSLPHWTHATLSIVAAVAMLVAAVALLFVARFSMRRSLLEHFNGAEPIGLRLSWGMTLLFGGLYFQYQFNRINELKRAQAALGSPPIAPTAAR